MIDLARTGNLIEAGVWFVLALVLLVQALRSPGRVRRVLGRLSAAFAVFGISDLIESQTGAWWRPWWLLVLKGTCLLVLILGFREYYRIKKL